PEIREGDFWVLVNWHMDSPGAPEIGVDANPPNNNRGMYYTQTLGWQLFNYGNIMITAYVSDTPVDVNEGSSQELPLTFDLKQNYPNPFNPTTVITIGTWILPVHPKSVWMPIRRIIIGVCTIHKLLAGSFSTMVIL